MEIKPKMPHVSGTFDTKTGMLQCIPYRKHGEVLLGIADDDNSAIIPIAKIKLYTSNLWKDFEATYEDASALGNEIARRFNEFPQDQKK